MLPVSTPPPPHTPPSSSLLPFLHVLLFVASVIRSVVAVLTAAGAVGGRRLPPRPRPEPGPGPSVLPALPSHHVDGRLAATSATAAGGALGGVLRGGGGRRRKGRGGSGRRRRGAVAHGVLPAPQAHPLALDLGAVVLEPELDVLGLQLGELLAVLGRVERLRVLVDHVGRGVRVLHEPLLQLGDLRQRVDEHPRPPLAGLRRRGR